VTRAYMELHELEPGARFMFAAKDLPNRDPYTLVSKSVGRALIRHDRKREPETRTFEARDRNGQKVTRTVTVNRENDLERCALGSQVVPLTASEAGA
jgi:hypothetical protein